MSMSEFQESHTHTHTHCVVSHSQTAMYTHPHGVWRSHNLACILVTCCTEVRDKLYHRHIYRDGFMRDDTFHCCVIVYSWLYSTAKRSAVQARPVAPALYGQQVIKSNPIKSVYLSISAYNVVHVTDISSKH